MSVRIAWPDLLAGLWHGWERVARRLRRVPRAGWVVFVIAFVNFAVWSIVVPPFEVPDEQAHFAYAQYFAETGKAPPQTATDPYSPQLEEALGAVRQGAIIFRVDARGILNRQQQRSFDQQMAVPASPVGTGGASVTSNQPPLYYALEAIPYWLSPSHNLLARLAFMRLLSALMGACTVLSIFLFIRELLPGTPWAWTIGALAVAFEPQVAFISAGVNGDNLLYLASAATLLALVRAYRRGLTYRRAALLGVAVAVGLLAKLTFLGLVPGFALATLLLGYRDWRRQGHGHACKAVVLAGAIAFIPYLIYGLLNLTAWHRGSFLAGGLNGATGASAGGHVVTLRDTLEYIWEFYLPRLPFMHQTFHPFYGARTVWIDGFIGTFGWLDYGFPGWVYTAGLYVLGLMFVLACVSCWRWRARIRRWLPLILCLLVSVAGLVYEIGAAGIRGFYSVGGFEQARYLFPLLALYGLMVALAPKALPRRWAGVLAGALVVLLMTHGLFGELITISRYYG